MLLIAWSRSGRRPRGRAAPSNSPGSSDGRGGGTRGGRGARRASSCWHPPAGVQACHLRGWPPVIGEDRGRGWRGARFGGESGSEIEIELEAGFEGALGGSRLELVVAVGLLGGPAVANDVDQGGGAEVTAGGFTDPGL